MNLKKFNILITLFIFLFTSCGSTDEIQTIEGNWEVTSIKDMTDFSDAPNFTMNLETMKIAGFSGCNRFFGSIKTQDNSLSFDQMGGTRMACPDFTVENLFITTIPEVKSFTFKKNILQLLSDSNEVILTLKPIETEQY